MKSCPKCKRNFDNLLDFCLEDGTRLLPITPAVATVTTEARPPQTSSPTISYPVAPIHAAAGDLSRAAEVETVVAKKAIMGEDVIPRTTAIFEYVAIVTSLAHNWWQWLYLEKQYVSSIFDYILSANFLMWLLLLVAGTSASLFVVRRSERKTLGVLSLVVLAINLILFLVPRR